MTRHKSGTAHGSFSHTKTAGSSANADASAGSRPREPRSARRSVIGGFPTPPGGGDLDRAYVLPTAPITLNTTLDAAIAAYLSACEVRVGLGRLAPATLTFRRWGLSHVGRLGGLQLGQLRRSLVIARMEEISATEPASAEFAFCQALRSLVRWCADRDAASLDVVSRLGHGYRPPAGHAISWPERERLRRVLARMLSKTDPAHTDVQVVRILLETGARACEVRCARLEDYDVDMHVIRVAGVAAKSRVPRVVVLSHGADDLVRRRLPVTEPGAYLFPSTRTGRAWTHQHLMHVLQDAAAVAGVRGARELGLHVLRHSFATHAYEAGLPITDVSASLGHRDIRTTRAFYLHNAVDPGARRAVEALNPSEVTP